MDEKCPAPDGPDHAASGAPPPHGISMVARFRAARIAQRPALRAAMRGDRGALRAERIARLGLQPAAPVEPALEPAAQEAPQIMPAPASVFAQFVADERQAAPASEPQATMHDIAEAPAPCLAESVVEAPAPPPLPAASPLCPDFAALGFGPGMTARLRHVGIVSVVDLATADGLELRAALGDVGDLIDITQWIGRARGLLQDA